jgi:hypothetical protein
MIENTHPRPVLIYRTVDGDPFESEQQAKGEEKSNRNNPTFKNRRNLMNPNDITFSNRNKNTTSASPQFRPWPLQKTVEDGGAAVAMSQTRPRRLERK